MLPELLLSIQLQKNKIDTTQLNLQAIQPQAIITSINIANSKDLALQPETAVYTDISGKALTPADIENKQKQGGDLEYIVVENGGKIIRKDKVFSSEASVQQYLAQEFKLGSFDKILEIKPGDTRTFGDLKIVGLEDHGYQAWRIEFSYNKKYIYELRKYVTRDDSFKLDPNLSRPHYDFTIKSTDGKPFNFNSRIKNVSEIDTHLVY